MSAGGEPAWIGKKPPKRLGGMAEALSIAADLGFSIPPPITVPNPFLFSHHTQSSMLGFALFPKFMNWVCFVLEFRAFGLLNYTAFD